MNTTQEMSKLFGIGESTVRKWASILEKNGYKFFTEDKNKLSVRYFNKQDFQVFEYFQRLLKENKMMSLDTTAQACVERFGRGYVPSESGLMANTATASPLISVSAIHEEMKELKEVVKVLVSEISGLKQTLENQEQFQHINKLLLESKAETSIALEAKVNELEAKLDTTKLEILEEITKTRTETYSKKRGFFTRFFGG